MKQRILSIALLVALLFSLATVFSVTAEEAGEPTAPAADIAPLSGAAIRVGESAETSGLRFAFTVNRAWFDALEGEVTVGALIAPTDYLTVEFTKEALDAAEITYLDIVTDGKWNAETTETDYCFYASIVDLKDANYARAFTAVAYVTTSEGTVYSARTESRSVYEVARKFAASADFATSSPAKQERVKSYIDSVLALDPNTLAITPAYEGYTSPYTVAWEDKEMTVSGAVANIKTVLIGKLVYTGGWTKGETLTATYNHEHYYKHAGTASDHYTAFLECMNCGAKTHKNPTAVAVFDKLDTWSGNFIQNVSNCTMTNGVLTTQNGSWKCLGTISGLDISAPTTVVSYSFDYKLTQNAGSTGTAHTFTVKMFGSNLQWFYTTGSADGYTFTVMSHNDGNQAQGWANPWQLSLSYGQTYNFRIDYRFRADTADSTKAVPVSALFYIDGVMVLETNVFNQDLTMVDPANSAGNNFRLEVADGNMDTAVEFSYAKLYLIKE